MNVDATTFKLAKKTDIPTSANDVGAAPENHKQAYVASELDTYEADENTMGVTPAGVKKAIGLFEPKPHTHSDLLDFKVYFDDTTASSLIDLFNKKALSARSKFIARGVFADYGGWSGHVLDCSLVKLLIAMYWACILHPMVYTRYGCPMEQAVAAM